MMKKGFLFLIVGLICLSFAGCGAKEASDSPSPSGEPYESAEPTPETDPEPVNIKIGTVHDVDTYLNVRNGPGIEFDIIGKAHTGDRFTVLVEFYTEEWHQVDLNGETAYIHANYLSITLEPVPMDSDPIGIDPTDS